MITRICGHCGRPYETYPSIRKQFCSAVCAGLFKRQRKEVPCEVCGKLVVTRPSEARRFCSKSCAHTAANLTEANPSRRRDGSVPAKRRPRPKTARPAAGPKAPQRRGPDSPLWKGGVRRRKDGYVRVMAPPGHPHPSDVVAGVAWILEHRLVMEGLLGRYLLPEEVVHHRDLDPSNNAPDNLQLFANQGEHMRLGHPRRRITHRLRERLALPPQ